MSGLCSLLSKEGKHLAFRYWIAIHQERGRVGMLSYYLGSSGLDSDIKDVVAKCGVSKALMADEH